MYLGTMIAINSVKKTMLRSLLLITIGVLYGIRMFSQENINAKIIESISESGVSTVRMFLENNSTDTIYYVSSGNSNVIQGKQVFKRNNKITNSQFFFGCAMGLYKKALPPLTKKEFLFFARARTNSEDEYYILLYSQKNGEPNMVKISK